MLSVVWFTVCLLACLACACKAVINRTTAKVPIARVVWIRLAAAEFSARTVWNLLAAAKVRRECVLKSYCQNVVGTRTVRLCRYCAPTLCRTFSASLPRNGNVVVHRRTSSRAVLHRRGRWCSTRTISSARRSPGVSWNVNGSGRVVPSHRIGSYRFIWSRLLIVDTPSEQFVGLLLIACRRSQSVSIHAGRSLVVVNIMIRVTARLQSLPLARCWRACFALFSSFLSLLFRLTLTVIKLIVCNFCSGHCHLKELNDLCIWRLC